MKTLELDLKKKVLIVDESDFDYYELSENGIYFKLEKGDRYYLGWKFEFLCKGSELTEEIASEFMSDFDAFNEFALKYEYLKNFIYIVESKGFYWLKHNVRNFSLYDPRSKTGCHDLEEEDTITKQWQEAEEKTFRNPLIFIKKS